MNRSLILGEDMLLRNCFMSCTISMVLCVVFAADSSASCWRWRSACRPRIHPTQPVCPEPASPHLTLSQIQPQDLPKSVASPDWRTHNGEEVTWLARVDDVQPRDPTAMRVKFISDDIVIDAYFSELEQLSLARQLRPGSIVVLQGIINMPYEKLALRLDRCQIVLVQAR